MKKGVFVVGLLVVLLLSINNYFQIQSLKEAVRDTANEPAKRLEEEPYKDIELGDVMTKLQRHSNKLWFAGQAGNWPLAGFYIHELEESFEELTEHEIIYEGVNITVLTERMGLQPLKSVEEAIEKKDAAAFLNSFENLTRQCNDCHQSSNHPFVVIKTPGRPVFDNQEYERAP